MLEVYRDKPADKLLGRRKNVPPLKIMGSGDVQNLIWEDVQTPEEMLVSSTHMHAQRSKHATNTRERAECTHDVTHAPSHAQKHMHAHKNSGHPHCADV